MLAIFIHLQFYGYQIMSSNEFWGLMAGLLVIPCISQACSYHRSLQCLFPPPGIYGWLFLNTCGSVQLSDSQIDFSWPTYSKCFSFIPAHSPISSSDSVFFSLCSTYHYLKFFIIFISFCIFCFIYTFNSLIFLMSCLIHYYFSSTLKSSWYTVGSW